VAARLITLSDGRAEVAHEALFREWPRLRGWLADDVAGRDVLRRLARDAAEWGAHQRDETLLWRGTRLLAGAEIAQAHDAEITIVERDFLDHGQRLLDSEQQAAEDRAAAASAQNSRLRRLLGALVLVLVLALVAGGLALRSRDQADTARAAAEAKRLAATAVTEDYLDLALLSAVEAVRSERSPETYGALLTLLGRLPDVLTQVRTRNRFLGGAPSPDRRTVYLWENEPVLRAIVATTGDPRWTIDLPGPALWVSGSPDGRLLAVPCFTEAGPAVLLLDARTGKEVKRIAGTTDGDIAGKSPPVLVPGLLPQAVWLSDSRLGVLASSGLLVVDRSTWKPDQPVSWQPDDVSESAVLRSLGPARVVVSGSDLPVVVVDVARRHTQTLKVDGDVQAASQDGSVVALTTWPSGADGGRGASLTLLDGTSFKPLAPLIALPGFHGGIAFSADGTQVAVGAGDLVQVRNSHTGELVRELSGHSGTVMGATFTRPGENLLWSIGRDGTAFQWDLTRSRGVIRSAPSEVATHLGAASADGRVGVAMTFNETKPNEVFRLDPGSGRQLGAGPLPIPDGCPCQPWSVAVTPDGATALGGLEELSKPNDWEGPRTGRLLLWDVANGTIRSQVALPWPVIGLGVVPDGSRAVVNGTGGWAVVDLTQPRIQASVKDSPTDMLELPDTVAVSPDGRTAALGRGRDVVLVNTGTGAEQRRRSLPEGDGMLTGTWTDDRTLVVGGWRGVLHVLQSSNLADIAPARLVAPGWITDLVTSPDGRLVASTDTDGQVMLLDTASWKPLGKPVVKRGGWGWLSFSPDGHTLQAYFDRSDRAEMSMDPNDWLRSACRLAARELSRDEWAAVHPDQPWRATCGRDGAAAVAATR
jgi:WD40 repeat protein